MWQMGGVGPMFGQLGFFNKFAGKDDEDKRPRDRYAAESARLLGVLDERLADREWVMDEGYSIADIALLGWVRNLIGFYDAREIVGFDRFAHVARWRSEEHTSELQSLMRISYAVFCLKKKKLNYKLT